MVKAVKSIEIAQNSEYKVVVSVDKNSTQFFVASYSKWEYIYIMELWVTNMHIHMHHHCLPAEAPADITPDSLTLTSCSVPSLRIVHCKDEG